MIERLRRPMAAVLTAALAAVPLSLLATGTAEAATAPTVVGTSTASGNSANPSALSFPGGMDGVNDVGVFSITQAGTQTTTGPAGWSLGYQQSINNNDKLSVWTKVLAPGDVGTTVAATFAAGQRYAESLIVFNGAKALDVIDATGVLKTTGSTSVTEPAVTPGANDGILVYVDGDRATTTSVTPDTTAPTGYTEQTDAVLADSGNRISNTIGTKALTGGAGTAQGPATATTSTATTSVSTQLVISASTRYYFSTSGSDSNDCLTESTPCLTLAKASGMLVNPGDRVSLKRGDTWAHEGLLITTSGTAGAPMLVDAYGSGALPKITYGVQTSGKKGACIRAEGNYLTVDSVHLGDVSLGTGSCSDSSTFNYGYGINALGTYITVQNSESEGNAAGYRMSGDYGRVTASSAHDSRESVNTITPTTDDSGTFGILVNGDHVEVDHNTFYGNRATSYDYGYDGSDVEMFGANYTNIHHNVSTGGSNGFSESGKSGLDTNSDNTIEYNVFVNDGSTAGDAETHGITLRGSGSSYGPNERYSIRHNTFLIKYTGGGTDSTQAIGCSASCPSSTVITDNILVASFRALYDDNASSTVATNVYQGAVSTITMPGGNINSAPLTVSSTDAHLTSSSPAIDVASTAPSSTDAFGASVPQDGDCNATATTDIGAAEYDNPGC